MILMWCTATEKDERQIIIEETEDNITLKCEGCQKTRSYKIGEFVQKYYTSEDWDEKPATCVWCGEELIFDQKKGYVHKSDGKLYKQRPDGKDDHCALPKHS